MSFWYRDPKYIGYKSDWRKWNVLRCSFDAQHDPTYDSMGAMWHATVFVTIWTDKLHDSGRTKFLAIGHVRCIRNVTKLVSRTSWFITKLAGPVDVAILPAITECIARLLADESTLHSIFAWSWVAHIFTIQSELFTNEPAVCGQSSVLHNDAELQFTVHGILAKFKRLFPNIAQLLSDIELPVVNAVILRRWLKYVLPQQCVLPNWHKLFAQLPQLLPELTILLALESFVFTNFSMLFAGFTVVLALIGQLHAQHSVVLADISELFGLTALFPGVTCVLADWWQVFTHVADIFAAVAFV